MQSASHMKWVNSKEAAHTIAYKSCLSVSHLICQGCIWIVSLQGVSIQKVDTAACTRKGVAGREVTLDQRCW